MRSRCSNPGFFERLRGPSSVSYRGELQRRKAEGRKQARLEKMRQRDRDREELRRERDQIREANKLKRRMLKEEQAERRAEAKQRERERAESAIPSRSAIERAYQKGAQTLSEAIEMARKGNPKGKKGDFARCVEAVSSRDGAYDPEAVCAAQERRKYGQKELTRRAVAGKRAAKRKNAEVRVYPSDRFKGKWSVARVGGVVQTRKSKRGAISWAKRMLMPGDQLIVRDNPADAAMAVSEEFHGRKVKAMIPVQQKRHYHKYLAELGELRKLEVLARDGKHKVTLSKFDGAMLCANEDKNQLFIVDGDQSVNLSDFGIRNPHETETLGEVTRIEYFTDKEHLGSEGGTAVYVHKFRTTNGRNGHATVRMARNPDLIYHLRDEHLEFSGGSYEIKAEGIDK